MGFICNKKLTSITIRARISHRDNPSSGMFQGLYNFILKFPIWGVVDRFSTFTRPSWVTTLDHKAFNVAVEYSFIVIPGGTESEEIGGGAGDFVAVNF